MFSTGLKPQCPPQCGCPSHSGSDRDDASSIVSGTSYLQYLDYAGRQDAETASIASTSSAASISSFAERLGFMIRSGKVNERELVQYFHENPIFDQSEQHLAQYFPMPVFRSDAEIGILPRDTPDLTRTSSEATDAVELHSPAPISLAHQFDFDDSIASLSSSDVSDPKDAHDYSLTSSDQQLTAESTFSVHRDDLSLSDAKLPTDYCIWEPETVSPPPVPDIDQYLSGPVMDKLCANMLEDVKSEILFATEHVYPHPPDAGAGAGDGPSFSRAVCDRCGDESVYFDTVITRLGIRLRAAALETHKDKTMTPLEIHLLAKVVRSEVQREMIQHVANQRALSM
ncbi:uncharacterized protein V1510DRAFT_423654 [Dipodascopsis tothii]|uniref:uncharacterized protein n=1 Tax=Dipodascopsis tothii TaxID=44089 RepID=UPI0034CFD905